MIDKLLKPMEVAQILGVSKALAYRLISQRQLSCVRFGRTVRVKQEDLQEFIQRNLLKPSMSREGQPLINLKGV